VFIADTDLGIIPASKRIKRSGLKNMQATNPIILYI